MIGTDIVQSSEHRNQVGFGGIVRSESSMETASLYVDINNYRNKKHFVDMVKDLGDKLGGGGPRL